MKLTDNELREVTKLLEAGRPLPDKYRFEHFCHLAEFVVGEFHKGPQAIHE